ncbi:MAG: CBS domain-containing protein [Betaproteobacteria bacterium]|nr:CBS domain-containing protein [Betaproteobacteria bacterium]
MTNFNFLVPPFDTLTVEQQRWVSDSVDIEYYPEGEIVLSAEDKPNYLLMIIKGHVKHEEAGEINYIYGPDECFDARGIMSGQINGYFKAAEELIAYRIPKTTINKLIASNNAFGSLLFADLSNKLRAREERSSQRELHSLMHSKVEKTFIRPPIIVAASTSIYDVCQKLNQEKLSHLLVKKEDQLGIFTATDLLKAVLSDTNLHSLEVGSLASWSLIEIDTQKSVLDALILMIRHGVHRLVVKHDQQLIGVLDQLDLMSFISNHSHLIWLQIQQVNKPEELRQVVDNLTKVIQLLCESEVKITMISQLITELNRKVFTRLWQLIAPIELQQNSCVLVMGSEGRGEQILKTDQDNALIINDNYHYSDVAQVAQRFNDYLDELGYPPCLGGVMMRNPLWCQTLSDFKETVRQWIYHPSPENHMRLAIFSDAEAVCGDTALLQALKQYYWERLGDSSSFYAHFARAGEIETELSSSWIGRLLGSTTEDNLVDIKKIGIFPIVHGVRSLSLELGVTVTNTNERISELVRLGALSEEMAIDLSETLGFLMSLRVKRGLIQLSMGLRPDNQLDLSQLSTLDKDVFKDSLQIVKRFKQLIHYHFKLDAL